MLLVLQQNILIPYCHLTTQHKQWVAMRCLKWREKENGCPHKPWWKEAILLSCQAPSGKTKKPVPVTAVTGACIPGGNGIVHNCHIAPSGGICRAMLEPSETAHLKSAMTPASQAAMWHEPWPRAVHLCYLLKHTACTTITASWFDSYDRIWDFM